jgi:hypothetical protein
MGEQSFSCLRDLELFFEVGLIVINRRYDNHREQMYRYVVRRRFDLVETIIPFFREHRMRSAKQRNFEKFARCVEMVDAGWHLDPEGLIEIAEIADHKPAKTQA